MMISVEVDKIDFAHPTAIDVTGIAAVESDTNTADERDIYLESTFEMNSIFILPEITLTESVMITMHTPAKMYFS